MLHIVLDNLQEKDFVLLCEARTAESLILSSGLGQWFYRAGETLKNLIMTISASVFVLDLVNYWGPVRIIHRLHFPRECAVIGSGRVMPAGYHQGVIDQVNLREIGADREPTLRELMDQLFQRVGQVRCGWFDESGHLKNEHRRELGWPVP